jgi:hypothetical protein
MAELCDRDNVECTHGDPRPCWVGWELALGGEDDGYGTDACDWCGNEDHGDRFTASAFMMRAEHWVRQGRQLVTVARIARGVGRLSEAASLLTRVSEYVQLAVNARRYATEYLSGASS